VTAMNARNGEPAPGRDEDPGVRGTGVDQAPKILKAADTAVIHYLFTGKDPSSDPVPDTADALPDTNPVTDAVPVQDAGAVPGPGTAAPQGTIQSQDTSQAPGAGSTQNRRHRTWRSRNRQILGRQPRSRKAREKQAMDQLPETKGLSLVWDFVRRRPRPYIIALSLGLLGAGLSMIQPLIIRDLIKGMPSHQGVLIPIIILIVLFLVVAALGAVEEYILDGTGERLVHDVRTRVSGHILRLPMASHNMFQPGDLISRVTADSTVLQQLVTTDTADSLIGLVTMLGSIVIMGLLDPILLACCMTTMVVGGLIIKRLYKRGVRASVRAQRSLGRVSAALDRALRAIRTVKISRAEARETEQISAESAKVRDAGLVIARLQATVDPLVALCVQGSVVIVLGVGASQVTSGVISLGTLVAFLMYLTRVLSPLVQTVGFTQQLQRGGAANQRLREVLDLPVEKAPEPPTAELPATKAAARRTGEGAVRVVFDDVTFGYDPAMPILEHVSAVIEPGMCVAFVGPSGAGKTSLLHLLAGFYYPDSGSVLIDGVDTREIPLSRLREFIGFVEQEAPVLEGTIAENITYAAPDSDPEQITDVVESAGLRDRIEEFEEGLDTLAGNSGSMLSGGERQRVAMARALLASPRLLLLDEVTSQLDSLSERAVRDTIQQAASEECTVIVVAHRLSTVLQADRIIVMRDHTVETVGTHDELMTGSAFYRSLVTAQILGEVDVPVDGNIPANQLPNPLTTPN
jgi:ABC-type multidrug transport system fused ATPase/permease subunit